MNYGVLNYLIYISISVGLTIWVGRTLHKNGRVFIFDAFNGNESLADSVNHLLLVGFYLINFGYVTLRLKTDQPPFNALSMIEDLSVKIGVVLLVLGGMHFFNIFILHLLRKRPKDKVKTVQTAMVQR